MAAHPQILSQEYLKECFSYDPDSGILTWRVRPLEHFKNSHRMNNWNSRYSGKKAGWASGHGCLSVRINRKRYGAHRIIWKLETGSWPAAEIDHINGNPSDNRMSNLREVTRQENLRNASLRCDNSSGVTGVHWYAASRKWMAQIRVDRKNIHLGYFAYKPNAIAARKAAEIKYGFHKNHGRAKAPQ